MDDLFTLHGTKKRDPEIATWFSTGDPYCLMVEAWFEQMRDCGDDVREVLHDGGPTACVGNVAFAYVNAFQAHASVGFFYGATLADPAGLLEGHGKRMRHVKLRPGKSINGAAVHNLIAAAYADIRKRLG
jgi:hypothetical protein